LRSPLFAVLGFLLVIGCGDDGGSSGGSGKVVQFSFECEAQTPDCSGADHVLKHTFGETIEMTCTWNCATNPTEYVDTDPQKHSDPASYVFTFRKVGDGCLDVYDVAQADCFDGYPDYGLGHNW